MATVVRGGRGLATWIHPRSVLCAQVGRVVGNKGLSLRVS